MHEWLIAAANAKRQPGQALVAISHAHMAGGSISEDSERSLIIGNAEALPASLFGPSISYVALGHLHKPQKVNGEERIRYSGSPIPLSFSEIGYQHQILDIQLDGETLVSVEPRLIPRAVNLQRLGPAPLAEILLQLEELPDIDLLAEEQRQPWLEVRVRLDEPQPDLRQQVESALDGKAVRLVRIAAEYAGNGGREGDDGAAQLVELDQLSPRTCSAAPGWTATAARWMNRPSRTSRNCSRKCSTRRSSHEDSRHPPEEPGLLAGPFEIDFSAEPLASAGLFAITGPTGAGKSTLLDALCLALFGAVPRLNNIGRETKVPEVDSEMLTSDPRTLLRRGTGSGYAEVDFVGIDGHRYRARWETNRARDKANGKLQASKQSLHDLDSNQLLASQKRDYEQLIEAKLGLNFEQFTRAVMLAQSEFSAFLKADDKERSELLEKLTNTSIYSQLGRRAYSKSKEAEEQHKTLKAQASGITAGARGPRRAGPAFRRRPATAQGQQAQLKQLELQHGWLKELQQLQDQQRSAAEQLQQAQATWEGLGSERTRLTRLEQLAPQRHQFARQVELNQQLTPLRDRSGNSASNKAQSNNARANWSSNWPRPRPRCSPPRNSKAPAPRCCARPLPSKAPSPTWARPAAKPASSRTNCNRPANKASRRSRPCSNSSAWWANACSGLPNSWNTAPIWRR